MTEPSLNAAEAEVCLLLDELRRRLLERARRFGAAQEVDVDPPDLPVSELDVARTTALVGIRRGTAAQLRNDRGRNDLRRPFGEDACLCLLYTSPSPRDS